MTETSPSPENDTSLNNQLDVVIDYYLDGDEFLKSLDESDKIGAVYGQLLEIGEDPDIILRDIGVTEEQGNE